MKQILIFTFVMITTHTMQTANRAALQQTTPPVTEPFFDASSLEGVQKTLATLNQPDIVLQTTQPQNIQTRRNLISLLMKLQDAHAQLAHKNGSLAARMGLT